MKQLPITHRIIVLLTHPRKGAIYGVSDELSYALPALVLTLMTARGKLKLESNRVRLINEKPNDELEQMVVQPLQKKNRAPRIKTFVSQLANNAEKFLKIIRNDLIKKGWMQEKRRLFLGIFPYRRYLLTNPYKQQEYNHRLKAILKQNQKPTEDEKLLLAFLSAVHYEYKLTDERRERIRLGKALKEYGNAEYISRETGKAISEMQTMLAAATAATVATSAAAAGASSGS